MQLQHELTMKRLEIEQKRGQDYLGVSRETANLLTVGGTCVQWSLARVMNAHGHKSKLGLSSATSQTVRNEICQA